MIIVVDECGVDGPDHCSDGWGTTSLAVPEVDVYMVAEVVFGDGGSSGGTVQGTACHDSQPLLSGVLPS